MSPSVRSTGILIKDQVGPPDAPDTRRRVTLGTAQKDVLFELRDA
jgi:hypothetical protein